MTNVFNHILNYRIISITRNGGCVWKNSSIRHPIRPSRRFWRLRGDGVFILDLDDMISVFKDFNIPLTVAITLAANATEQAKTSLTEATTAAISPSI